MALVIVPKYEVSIDVTKLRVTDITGAYAASNVTGWGAPNLELDETALWFVVKRKASTGDEYFEPVTNQVIYDNAAINSKQTAIDFDYLNDGVLEVTIGALKVSLDGINYVSGGAIANNDFFYWSSAGQLVWKMVASVPTAVEDVNDLLNEVATVVQTTVNDIILPRLAVVKQGLYKEYRIKRDTKCDDAEELFDEIQKLSQDIQGAIYAFYSDLTIEAQDQVETMLDRYELVNL